jgi:hypothetical protein
MSKENIPNDDALLDSYPEGHYAVVQGSVIDGYKFWGPFPTIRQAVSWADKYQTFLGFISIVSIESPDKFPVKLNEEAPQDR